MDEPTGVSGAARLTRVLAPGLVLVALGVLGFVGLLDAVLERDDLAALDDPLLGWLVDHRSEGLTTALTVVTDTFGPVILPGLVVVGCIVWWRLSRSWWDPALLAGAMVLSTLLSMGIKLVVERPRPAADLMSIPGFETSFSFPSGHTIGASTLVLVAGYLVWHRRRQGRVAAGGLLVWAVASVVVVLLVGGSRLYLGYHFLTDVLAGVCVAVVVLGVVVCVNCWHERPVVDDSH
ncbi:hypothetical protein GCM10025865_00750 [Paraoerskovia sediminicola]|uniref:Phosphatidic acid phosphatase type 2/haloperoxidase domain-containing protein n=1 Tax=Paraoerskovia sediminicola TaxID=1138587 RepID=A0ABM8FYF9_9CELL|nr:phosphatase PAP2 family protein [Paraoerskovia sediminicola]BDZ40776.1 hypothetical protein GCM10025865_00750 [Paraoerskovia sediminicola]